MVETSREERAKMRVLLRPTDLKPRCLADEVRPHVLLHHWESSRENFDRTEWMSLGSAREVTPRKVAALVRPT